VVDSSHNAGQDGESADPSVESETNRQVAEAMELYLAEWEAGRIPDRQQFLRQHAEIADELEDHLQGLEFICQVGPRIADSVDPGSSAPDGPLRPLATLGDFRIVREIGRGGMGVVYEAEQLSLGRTVALKILPFAAMLDQKQRKRFQTEARAAASLEHPNIIPVYCVGNERGVTYYAMQLIRGMTVADVIKRLRQERPAGGDASRSDTLQGLAGQRNKDRSDPCTRQGTGGKNLDCSRSNAPSDVANAATSTEPQTAGTGSRTAGQTSIPSGSSSGRHAFARTVAQLGVQAAEGLEHAHMQGIVHRDIKPGNLMLDGNGKLYVMDFGLARIEADPGMTMTGTVLGTLRYMAPEQALSERGIVDYRADIYSLGATLYELLTLRPAREGEDRRALLKQIATDPPRPLRKQDRSIPADLETIILKAMAKEPPLRYRSAQELADDLKRFLEHKPIKAKRPSWLELGAKWSIRHQPIVWSSLVVLLLATIGLAISNTIVTRQKAATTDALATAENNRIQSETHRQRAEEAVEFSQKLLYVRDLSLAAHARKAGDFVRAAALIRSNPAFSQRTDLRGFEWYYLRRTVMQSHVIVTSQEEAICAVCYAPDGNEFATADAAGSVHLWNAATRVRRIALRGHAALVQQIAYHPDGSLLASCSDDGTVRLWDVETGRQRKMIDEAHGGKDVYGVAFSHDGTLLATGGGDNRVRLWRVADGEPDGVLEGHDSGVRTVAFSPDDALLATAGNDRTVRIWDLKSKRHLRSLKGHMGMVLSVAFSPDGQVVASGGNDRTIRYWRPRTGLCELTIRGHHDGIESIAFLPGGDRIVAGDRGGNIRIWKTTRRILDQFELEDYEHFAATVISPNGRQCAALTSDGRLFVRDIAFGRTRLLAEGFPSTEWFGALDFSPDGQSLICGVRVFVVDSASILGWREAASYPGPVPTAIAFASAGRRLATAGSGAIRTWNVQTRTEIGSFKTSRNLVRSICFSPNAPLLATASADGGVELWDISTGERQAAKVGHSGGARTVTFSKSGRYLASSGADETVRVWDFSLGRPVGTFSEQRVHRVAFSPDERSLVCALADRTLRMWSLTDKVDRGSLFHNDRETSYQTGFWNVQFSSSGKELLCADSRAVFVLDMNRRSATTSPSGILQGHDDCVLSVAVSPDGDHILSASRDGTIRRWSPIQSRWKWLVGHRDNRHAVRDIVFTSDGSSLLVSRACQALLRSLPGGAAQSRLPVSDWPDTGSTMNAVAIGPDQRIAATGHRNGLVVLWDLDRQSKRRRISAFPEADEEVDVIAFSPDGARFAAASRCGNRIGLWDVSTGKRLQLFEAHDCDSLAFSPDGRLLAYCDGRDVVIWNRRARTQMKRLAGHAPTVNALAFAPDGGTLATTGEDRKIKLWDTTTWKERWERSAHAASVLSIAFSPDGRTLASGAEDGTINLWQAETGEEFFELARAATSVVKLVFSPTHDLLLALLNSGRVALFEGGEASSSFQRKVR